MVDAVPVPYQNSFLLVGGLVDGGRSGDIYHYNAEDDQWLEMESKLKTPRVDHVATLVRKSLFPECSYASTSTEGPEATGGPATNEGPATTEGPFTTV